MYVKSVRTLVENKKNVFTDQDVHLKWAILA